MQSRQHVAWSHVPKNSAITQPNLCGFLLLTYVKVTSTVLKYALQDLYPEDAKVNMGKKMNWYIFTA